MSLEARAKADFRVFLWLVWQHLNLPEPTPIQYDIARYLQTGLRRIIIQAFRGIGKSWITSAFVCWLLLNNPQLNILVVSASKERADAFSTFTKRLIREMPILAHLQPKDGQRDSNVAFDVGPARASHSPSVKSVGITGQLAGSRADVIVADDVEIPNNSLTPVMREKLSEQVKEFDAILKPEGRIIYLGTPQTEESLYKLLQERGYKTRIWPARIPDDARKAKYGDQLAPFVRKLTGPPIRSVDPKRFSDMDLIEREASYGRSGFALQFMLDTDLSDQERYPLKLSDLIVTNVDDEQAPVKLSWGSAPEQIISDLPMLGFKTDRYHRPMMVSEKWAPYTGSVMYIDPSGRGGDETSFGIVKMLYGSLYVPRGGVGGFLTGYDDTTLAGLAAAAAKHKVNHILIESNFGDGMFTQLFLPHLLKVHRCGTEEVHNTGQKERRIIDTLEPVLNQHRLVVDRSVIEDDYKGGENPDYKLFRQLTRITRDRGALKHDDRLEALAGAVRYWVEQMARDQSTVESTHMDKLKDAQLRQFAQHVLGHKPRLPTWSRTGHAR